MTKISPKQESGLAPHLLKSAGFTLVEVLVSLAILTVAISPLLVTAVSSLRVSALIQNNLIASNLAQEGIEVIRNIRDNNWIAKPSFDTDLTLGVYAVEWNTTGADLTNQGPNSDQVNNPLKFNPATGIYGYAEGNSTIFARTIELIPEDYRIKVISTVTWQERQNEKHITLEYYLYDWLP